jgi:Ca-activated chloride channel family protein
VSIDLARPVWLLLLALIPVWHWWIRPRDRWGLLVARGEDARTVSIRDWVGRTLEIAPRALRSGGVACLILVLTQPQLVTTYEEPVTEGVAIAVAIDLSTSMGAQDMAQGTSRIEVAKRTVLEFLEDRTDDVGIVSFGGEALTRMPLTNDHYVVREAVDDLGGRLILDGTDIAGAIAAGAGLLRDAPHGSKMLILVTDGAHNGEGMTPARAAIAASAFDIRIYPIAIGTDYMLASSLEEMETVLTQAALITGGRYFRATDVAALEEIYQEIERIATPSQEMEVRTESTPIGLWFLLAAMLLLLLGAGLRGSKWGVLP